jgi:hypothetical protein
MSQKRTVGIEYPISDEQRVFSWDLVCRKNFGQRGNFDGDKRKQYTGILAQTVVADLLGVARPEISADWDHGIDYVVGGKKIDIKAMGRTRDPAPYMVNNLVASQVSAGETDVYLFASVNVDVPNVTVIGWMKKIDIPRSAHISEGVERTRSDGTRFATRADMFEIPNASLVPWESPGTFEVSMTMFG